MNLAERYSRVDTERNKFSNSAEAWRNGPPQRTRNVIKFEVWRKRDGSAAEAWRKWKMSLAERSMDAERTKFQTRRKRGGTTPLGVTVVSFRSVSTLGGKRGRNGSEVLCPGLTHPKI